MARRGGLVVACALAARLASASVAVITTTDCRSADPDTFREFGTQLTASMVILMRMKHMFPAWDGFLVTNRGKWRSPTCNAAWEDLSALYEATYGAPVRLVAFHVHHFPVLEIFSKVPGKETDHSRGHWPVEAYVHLVIGARLLDEYGYDHTVYVDPDAWPLDDALRFEVPKVRSVGCIAAIPAECLALGQPPATLPKHLTNGGVPVKEVAKVVKMARERADEYRLVTDPGHLAAVVAAAAAAGHAYEISNGTNSGVVIYNNRFLRDSHWADWLHSLINARRRRARPPSHAPPGLRRARRRSASAASTATRRPSPSPSGGATSTSTGSTPSSTSWSTARRTTSTARAAPTRSTAGPPSPSTPPPPTAGGPRRRLCRPTGR